MTADRLQKLLAAAGVASRRAAEEMIREGRVTVNGEVVTELGVKADPAIDHVKVDGKLLRTPAAAAVHPDEQAPRRRRHARRPPAPADGLRCSSARASRSPSSPWAGSTSTRRASSS